jgi:small-conductance mechanosensitive channel
MHHLSAFLPALIALVAGGLLSVLLPRVLKRLFTPLVKRTATGADDYLLMVFTESIPPIGWVISGSLAWHILPTHPESDRIAFSLAKLIMTVLVVRLLNRIGLRLLQSWGSHSSDPNMGKLLRALTPMFKALIWCFALVFYLQNIGVQMAAVWALLSAGGIGAGLALKEPLSQFFEYITIVVDKPFQNGDMIVVDGVWGTVEKVGVRSSRLRSLNGEVIVMSNSMLTGSVISNYGEMEERRLVHRLGVTYDTRSELLEAIPSIIEEVVQAVAQSRFDRCHFVGFSDSSLDFELVYYVNTADYKRALDVQQRINLQIVRRFESAGIAFAFPTRTLHLISENPS